MKSKLQAIWRIIWANESLLKEGVKMNEFDWNNITDLTYDGMFYIFTDNTGKQARMDKEAVIACVSNYKSQQN